MTLTGENWSEVEKMTRGYTEAEKRAGLLVSLRRCEELSGPGVDELRYSLAALSAQPAVNWTEAAMAVSAIRERAGARDRKVSWALAPFAIRANDIRAGRP